MPPGWASHKYSDTLTAWANGKAAQVYTFGRTVEFIEEVASPDKRNPEVFQIWPTTIGPSGKEPLAGMGNEGWCVFTDAPKAEKEAAREFLKFFFKRENYLRYVDSVPTQLLPIFKDYFQDTDFGSNPVRRKWKPWLDSMEQWMMRGRCHPIYIVDARDRLIPWIGAVGRAPIISDMVLAVVEKGQDPKVAAKEANERIHRDVIAPFKRA
jgi:ABC-type glycerol-3-phosphate transport system substrate-binding protein